MDGAVAKSLGKAGGKPLQLECHEYVTNNGNVPYGQIAVTSGGNIPCKCIVHAVGENYNSSQPQNSEKVASSINKLAYTVCMYVSLSTVVLNSRD